MSYVRGQGKTAVMPKPATLERDMLNAGTDIVPDRKDLAARRQKRGECPTCGRQTYKVGKLLGKRTPLTIEGTVYKGRCLACQPLEGYIRKPASATATAAGAGATTSLPQPPQHSQSQQPSRPPPPVQRNQGMSPPQSPPHRAKRSSNPRPPQAQPPPLEFQVDRLQEIPHPQQMMMMVPPTGANLVAMDPSPQEIHLQAQMMQQVHHHQQQQQQQQHQQLQQQYQLEPPHPHFPPGVGHAAQLPPSQTLQQQQQLLLQQAAAGPSGTMMMMHSANPNFVGRTLEVGDLDDGMSVVSAITMDHRLQGSDYYGNSYDDDDDDDDHGGYGHQGPALARRPGPEGDDALIMTTAQQQQQQQQRLLQQQRQQRMSFSKGSMRRFRDAMPPSVPEDGRYQVDQMGVATAAAASNGDGGGSGSRRSLSRLNGEAAAALGVGEMSMMTNGQQQQEIPISFPEQAYNLNGAGISSSNNNNSSAAFDADGYPIASNSYGWDRQADMLPPGGNMDSLLSPTPKKAPSHNEAPRRNSGTEEIQFLPPMTAGGPGDENGYEIDDQHPKRMPTINSAPSYQSDDDMDENLVAAQSALKSSEQLQSTHTRSSDAAPPLMAVRGKPDSGRGILDPSTSSPISVTRKQMQDAEEYEDIKDAAHDLVGTPTDDSAELLPSGRKERRRSKKKKDRKQERAARKAAVDAVVGLSKSVEPPGEQEVNLLSVSDAAAITSEERPLATAAAASSSTAVTDSTNDKKKKKKDGKSKKTSKQTAQNEKREDMHDIPAILHFLHQFDCSSSMREKALDSLATIMWRSGPKGREFVTDHQGVETLTKSMWDDMENAKVQESAMHIMFAMAASLDGEATNDMLANEDSICDSVLFSMQMHATVPGIQLNGCCIFACLAAASANNKDVSDGSLSGATTMTLNAMSNHESDPAIQKAGIQALHHQCYLSTHAESNKRTLMDCKLDNGMSGVDILLCGMEVMQDDCTSMEWASRICWCLTSSEDLLKAIASTPLQEALVPICQRHISNPASTSLVEATVGAIGNLAKIESKHMELADGGAVGVVFEAVHYYPTHMGIRHEAISAMANLSSSTYIRDSIVKSQGVEIVVQTLQSALSDPEFTGEVLRALVSMAVNAEAKAALTNAQTIELIDQISAQYHNSSLQEMCCALIATLSVGSETRAMLMETGAIQVLLRAMDKSPEEKVCCAACTALRNFSSEVQLLESLLEIGAGKSMIEAMERFESSQSIQLNACCFLWNVAQRGSTVSSEDVKKIVKAMQGHVESAPLLEMACGALWSIVESSADQKREVVATGAVDAVAVAMIMHPKTTATLERACGVLSNVSTEGSVAEAIANAQGVNIVAEAMRNNANAIGLLEVGCLTLRNLIFVFPDFAEEASIAIATVINAMQDNSNSLSFQREACNLLWILSSQSPICQSKVLALDGLSVLMKSMEQYSDDREIQEAALAAFNHLASSANDEDD